MALDYMQLEAGKCYSLHTIKGDTKFFFLYKWFCDCCLLGFANYPNNYSSYFCRLDWRNCESFRYSNFVKQQFRLVSVARTYKFKPEEDCL